jgi:hypothetical protein
MKVFLISIVLLTSTSTSYSLSLSGIAGISEKLEDLHKNYSDNVEKVKKNMCPKKSWCRKWEGVICGISKRFFSICHTVCHAEEGFMKSKCVKQAKKNHNFDIEYGVYGNNDTPLEDLIMEIKSSNMGQDVSKAICTWIKNPNILMSLIPNSESPSLLDACDAS